MFKCARCYNNRTDQINNVLQQFAPEASEYVQRIACTIKKTVKSIPKGQSKKDNPEKMATPGTQDTERK